MAAEAWKGDKSFREWAFSDLAYWHGRAVAGRAMRGRSYLEVWDLLGETGEAVDAGEPLPLIDPDDICSDDDLEFAGFNSFGEWEIALGRRNISTGPRSTWDGGEPCGRSRTTWMSTGWMTTTSYPKVTPPPRPSAS